ncbi:hypothetical protein [Spirulina sp. 06S082]|uniref:hypothetical protein n=1 Tax=Spirulina sp. 06S082 TaxID=3110248 RepID=UPI002B1EA7A5|nr:hypothetical protein [Spirulina sp. 06S082]MEA5467986.1 hypothetical protein [Spirulina sp. 06S082]
MSQYIPPPTYLQNQRIINSLESPINNASKIDVLVENIPSIILPFNATNRKKFVIFHDTEGEILLIDFQHDPTLTAYALALPAGKAIIDTNWQGQVKAISRSGNPILVHTREFNQVGE